MRQRAWQAMTKSWMHVWTDRSHISGIDHVISIHSVYEWGTHGLWTPVLDLNPGFKPGQTGVRIVGLAVLPARELFFFRRLLILVSGPLDQNLGTEILDPLLTRPSGVTCCGIGHVAYTLEPGSVYSGHTVRVINLHCSRFRPWTALLLSFYQNQILLFVYTKAQLQTFAVLVAPSLKPFALLLSPKPLHFAKIYTSSIVRGTNSSPISAMVICPLNPLTVILKECYLVMLVFRIKQEASVLPGMYIKFWKTTGGSLCIYLVREGFVASCLRLNNQAPKTC